MRISISRLAPIAAGLVLCAGCDRQSGTNAGFTNGPPPVASDKASARSDLPVPTDKGGERLGGLGDTSTSAGSGGVGANTQGASPDQPKTDATANSDTVRATPPAKAGGDANSAGGGTKPAETIKTGTPRSPQ